MSGENQNTPSGIRPLRFFLRRFGFDPGVTQLSETSDGLITELKGQGVAIVGNSRALGQQSHGAEIDGADIVIRINRAPMPSGESHGTKTHWLALATTLSERESRRIAPDRILWMSPKRKRLPLWVVKRRGFYLHPLTEYLDLKNRLGSPPTTGAMVIDLVTQSQAKSIDLYGFDFFASLSLTGSRTQAQVPHDFNAERDWVEGIAKQDPRLKVHR